MSYTIHLLKSAEEDYRHIFQYIRERSPQGSERWREAFQIACTRLQENPLFCGLAPESTALNFELRQILFGTPGGKRYRAVFRVDDNRVTIYRFRGPGQLPISTKDLPDV